MKPHDSQHLIQLFNACFEKTYNTQLLGGGEEPLYLPSSNEVPFNRIIFTRNYFRSALHECAHWCIAGAERRKQVDYGYWYAPDGRNSEQQAQFEQVEVKPQALEALFSEAAKHPFCISIDNLAQPDKDASVFSAAVQKQAALYLQEGLPVRAELFRLALIDFYS